MESQRRVYLARKGDGIPDQPLPLHLARVRETATCFAGHMGLESEAAYTAALHDLGKYRDVFQEYLAGKLARDSTGHAPIGSACAAQDRALPAAFAIAGHHAGLHDLADLQDLVRKVAPEDLPGVLACLRADGESPAYRPGPLFAELGSENRAKLTGEFATRMLFSTLVDADRLDAAYWPEVPPRGQCLAPATMLDSLRRAVEARRRADSALQRARDMVFEACLTAAGSPRGFFCLRVPTGGGKTLSSMAFALEHARLHGLRRVIVVIPYLSIIEQNAADYAGVFGHEAVLECHSAVDAASNEESRHRDLWTENWDAPLIVTTSVQFLESLLAASPAKCRKLHRVARSVVLFDEIQNLPTHLLRPALSVMRELAANYGVSFLFCSATPPVFRASTNLKEGFTGQELRPVLAEEDEKALFRDLKRVTYHLPEKDDALAWPELAARLVEVPQVLCVVNTTRHARELWLEVRCLLSEAHSVHMPFHLSAGMCAQHRFDKLAAIRMLLRHGIPCRVISTQLVEAGVDVDFPQVWRAFGPLDAIVQAAGRCNREGRLRNRSGDLVPGDVHVFHPADKRLPMGIYAAAADLAAVELDRLSSACGDPGEALATDTRLFERYFDALHGVAEVGADIQDMRANLRFDSVARESKVINDDGQPVVVPYGMGLRLLDSLRMQVARHASAHDIRAGFRAMQRYMVNLRRFTYDHYVAIDAIAPAWEGSPLFVLKGGFYDDDVGIVVEDRPPEDLIV